MPEAELPAPLPDANQMKDLDAVIVGAVLAGLSMPHRVRGLGLSARVLEAGRFGPLNDVPRWEYCWLTGLPGAAKGDRVETDGELAEAFRGAFADGSVYSIIDRRLGRFDVWAGFRRLEARLR